MIPARTARLSVLAMTAAVALAACGSSSSTKSGSTSNAAASAATTVAASVTTKAAATATTVAAAQTTKAAAAATTVSGAATTKASGAVTTAAGATVAPAAAGSKVNANTASQAELQAAFEAAGITNAAKWAREVTEYRPYPASDTNWSKLRQELAKYGPATELVDKIVATLTAA